MNNTVKTDRLDEAIWNRYRTTIESLYWENSLDKINAHMKKHHVFVASKSQYERHFRKWELRKNLTAAEWAATIRHLTENSIDLEQVEVLFKGREIPQNRVMQEIARRSSLVNTLHDGSHRLPKDITVRPRSRAPTINAANGLQIIPAPAASLSSSMQAESDVGLVTIISPSVHGLSLNEPTLIAEYSLPFSWTHAINFDSISQSLFASQQLVKWNKPSKMQLDAMFLSKHQSLVNTIYENHDTTVPLYAIASLVNNISTVGHSTSSDDAYALLKALPLRDVSQSLKALPAPILDSIKERVFATAVKIGDVDLVSTMLELNINAHEQIMMDRPHESKPTYPLQLAVASGHLAVAKALCMHTSRGATQSQLQELIDHVFEGERLGHRFFRASAQLSESERTELMCITLRAGARPDRKCLGTGYFNVSVASLKELVEASMANITVWLETGLLEHYFTEMKYSGQHAEVQAALAKDVFRFVLNVGQHQLPIGDSRLKTAILGALYAALRPHNERAVGMILEAFSHLGYQLNDGDAYIDDLRGRGFIDRSTLEAFDNADWNLAASSMIAQWSTRSPDKNGLTIEQRSGLNDAIEKHDIALAYHWYTLVNEDRSIVEFGPRIVELAIRLSNSSFAINVIEHMEDHSFLGVLGLVILLEHGDILTVSCLLLRNPIWKSALEAASRQNDFGALETLFFHSLSVPLMSDLKEGCTVMNQQVLQLCFRTVAYHLMARNDYKLYTWLLQLGMDAGEFHVFWDTELFVEKGSGMHCTFPGGIGTVLLLGQRNFTLPSLLAVAAEKSNMGWMKFLVIGGVPILDSMALLRAVKSRATVATIHFLLDAAKTASSKAERSYGVAALRQAIRYRDITRIDLLCGVVKFDEIEPFNEEFVGGEPAISPLGEAIIADDSEIARVLLKHGASPNVYVSFDGLKMLEHIKSHMRRVTPLLAAIDVQSLPLVKILVQHGAELQYTRNMGISRTPLQRAAETGSFDIVKYLVNQGATIDTAPVYSGGTALQLAAMNGFCGISAFLLERGADPNYPPAKGDGRTAFEAAAEWGHVDTMSLLMQWNVNLDAQFGEPPESQYERARRFAEKNGFMASKRFVEHLYGQRTREESWPAGLGLGSM